MRLYAKCLLHSFGWGLLIGFLVIAIIIGGRAVSAAQSYPTHLNLLIAWLVLAPTAFFMGLNILFLRDRVTNGLPATEVPIKFRPIQAFNKIFLQ